MTHACVSEVTAESVARTSVAQKSYACLLMYLGGHGTGTQFVGQSTGARGNSHARAAAIERDHAVATPRHGLVHLKIKLRIGQWVRSLGHNDKSTKQLLSVLRRAQERRRSRVEFSEQITACLPHSGGTERVAAARKRARLPEVHVVLVDVKRHFTWARQDLPEGLRDVRADRARLGRPRPARSCWPFRMQPRRVQRGLSVSLVCPTQWDSVRHREAEHATDHSNNHTAHCRVCDADSQPAMERMLNSQQTQPPHASGIVCCTPAKDNQKSEPASENEKKRWHFLV